MINVLSIISKNNLFKIDEIILAHGKDLILLVKKLIDLYVFALSLTML